MPMDVREGNCVRRTGDTMSGDLYLDDVSLIASAGHDLTLGTDAGSIIVIRSATGICIYIESTEVAATASNKSIYIDSVDGKLYFKDAAGAPHALY